MKLAQFRSVVLLAVLATVATASFFVAQSAYAADRPWTGTTNTTWSTSTNWTGGLPGSTDNAVFSGTFTNQPNLGVSATVGGVWMTGTPGQNDTISLSAGTALSINGNTINSIAGLGILVDNSNARTLTISAPVALGADQTWRNSSGNLFTATNVNTNAKALTIDGTGNDTVSGVISGSGAVTLAGTGNVVTFSGTNTFTGQLTVKSGTLAIPTINNTSANGTLGNSALPVILGGAGSTGTLHLTAGAGSSSKKFTLATGGTGVFQVEDPATLTLSGVIDGGGALVLTSSPTTSPSTLTLSGINTYSGGTTVYSGTLFGTNDASFGTGKVTFDTPAGTGGQLRNSGAPRTWTNDFVLAANSIVPVRSNSVTNKITLTGALTGTGTLVGNTSNAGYLVILGDISGFQGTYTQNSTNNASLGLSFEGTTAENQDGSQAHLILSGITSGFNVNTTVRFGATGQTTKFGELAGTGGVMLAGTSAGSITLEVGALVTGVNSSTFAGSILNSAQNNTTNPVSFRKVGSGALVLSGTNAYDGSTTVSAGTLVVGADAPTSSTNISHTPVSVQNGSDTITLASHGLANGDRVLINGTTVPGGVSATTIYFVRGVAGNTFKLSLTNTDTFIDITSAGAGVLATRATALGADNGAVVLNDSGTGINDVNLAIGGAFTIQRAVTVANQGTGVTSIGGLTDNNSTFSGLVTVNKGLTVGQFATTGSNALHVTGGITSGGGSQTITFGKTGFQGAVNVETTGITDGSGTIAVKVAGNTTTFATNNTYSGNTNVVAGILNVNSSLALQNSTLDMNGADSGAVTFTVANATLGGLTGSRNLTGPTGTLSIGNNGINTTYSGVLSGGSNLNKIGGGTLELTANNTYTGATTVSNGKLLANNTTGSATSGGPVTVSSGATLGGTGAVAGAVTVDAGGNLSPGASIESLGTGSLTFSADGTSGSTLKFEISGVNLADLVNAASGSLTIADPTSTVGATLNLVNAGAGLLHSGDKYTVIAYSNGPGSWNGNSFVNAPNLGYVFMGAKKFQINYQDATPGGNFTAETLPLVGSARFVTLTAVPELGSFITMGLVGCCAAGAVRLGKRYGLAFRI